MAFWLPVGLVVVILAGFNLLARRRQRKLLQRLRAEWGRPTERTRDLPEISHYHRVFAVDGESSLDARTGVDLNLDAVFTVLDRTESDIGQQLLYHRLRTTPTSDDLAAFEALMTRLSEDEALLEGMQGMARLPGVAAVGLSSGLPLAYSSMGAEIRAAGRPAPEHPTESWIQVVSPGYFDVMRLRLRSGRLFTRLDGAGSSRVVVVNETFAREVFGGAPVVGRHVLFGRSAGGQPLEVIGVVADIRYSGLGAFESRAEAFLSVHQPGPPAELFSFSPFISVRTAGDPSAVVPLLREAAAAAHPRASLEDVRTMDARLSATFAQPRFYAVFAGFFAALALFLAASGLYGLLSYTVAQRRREIGVRMALGAQARDIVALVVRQGAALVAAGAGAGLLAAAAASRILESFLFGVTAYDQFTFVGAPLSLAAIALVACWLPARRATRIDPMETLRAE